jgi:rubrerythrin
MDFVGRVVAAFIAMILILIFPLQYMAQIYIENTDTCIDDGTRQLVDTIRDKGYLDKPMYEEFIEDLDRTGELYDIEITDIHPISGQIASRTLYDAKYVNTKHVNTKHVDTDQGSFITASKHTDAKKMLLTGGNDATEGAFQTFSLANHSHTDACYTGHRHNSSCIVSGDMNQKVKIIFYRQDNIFESYVKCATCGNELYYARIWQGSEDSRAGWVHYAHYDNAGKISVFEGSSQATSKFRTEYDQVYKAGLFAYFIERSHLGEGFYDWRRNELYTWTLGPCSWTFGDLPICNGSTNKNNFTSYSVPFIGCVYCGQANYGKNYSCGQSQDENPVCNQIITSLTPTNPTQTVRRGESIITTAAATYLDGHTGIVNCSSNFNPNLDGTQTVTLSYTGYVDNAKNYVTIYRPITVTVISKVLSSISVSPESQVIIRNYAPSFTVYANYNDGSSVVLTPDQYSVSACNTSVSGKQTLTISYTEGGVTKTAPFDLYIDDLMSITVTPDIVTVDRYTKPNALPITVMANSLHFPPWNVTGDHNISGYSPDIIGTQTVTISYKYYDTTRTATIQVNVTGIHKTCSKCGTVYELKDDDTDQGCPLCKKTIVGISATPEYIELIQGQPLPVTVLVRYQDGSTQTTDSWSSDYDSQRLGAQDVTIEYGGYTDVVSVFIMETTVICPVCKTERPASEAICPICSETVISISAAPSNITVNRYDNIDLTVNATYADNSVRQVTDWSIDRTTSEEGVFTATVSYKNASTTIGLTVLPSSAKECSICGLSYDKGKYPNGCPVCSNELIGIEAYLVTGSRLIQRGTTPDIAVVLIFKDEHREVALDGYTIMDYEPYTMGEQMISISYNRFHTTLDIEVVNTLDSITCPNGHIYYRNEDGSDPGCPYCDIAKEANEEVLFFDITYTSEILEKLYHEGIYYFREKHYVSVVVSKKQKSLLTKIQRTFFMTSMLGRKKRFIYGGRVLS